MFTAVAVAQLVERGLVSFEKPVLEYLPDLRDTITDTVEVRHLLSHTSGIADYFDEETQRDEEYAEIWRKVPSYSMRTPSDFLPLFRGQPAYHKPGVRFRYSNAGYIVLGLLIEAVTGRGYVHHVAEEVFRKAGMNDSGFIELDSVQSRVAIGYVPTTPTANREETGWRTNHFSIPARGGPDGGAFATAEDIARFFDAMDGGRLVGPEMKRELALPKSEVDETSAYGYGFWLLRASGDDVWVGHPGEDPGCSARAFRRTSPDSRVIVLSNHSLGAGALFRRIREVLDESTSTFPG
jgi:CubicO group peptidase (beta-lactamase class C family)